MADKITQVEDFCTHSKILGRYQMKSTEERSFETLQNWQGQFALILFAILILAFVTCFLLIVVEIDKKIKFHRVLSLEYVLKVKNYSNTEYLIKSWIMVVMVIVGFFVAFFQAIYNYYSSLIGTMETKIVWSDHRK